MRFLVTYPLSAPGAADDFADGQAVARFARAAEAAGFDALGFTDHPAPTQRWLDRGGHDAFDPLCAMAFCAAATERLRLLPHILVLPYRNPLLAAKAIATVDRLSGGRVTVAAGAGYLRGEFAALGVDFAERNALFDEGLDAMKAIWTGNDVDFAGAHFTARGQTANPKPRQQPHPPLWIGGNSARARQRVVEHADGWVPFPAPPGVARTTKTPAIENAAQLQPLLDDLWRRLEAAGRERSEIDVHFPCMQGGSLGADDWRVEDQLAGIADLAGRGVGWTGASAPADSLAHALEALERYGAEVIARAR